MLAVLTAIEGRITAVIIPRDAAALRDTAEYAATAGPVDGARDHGGIDSSAVSDRADAGDRSWVSIVDPVAIARIESRYAPRWIMDSAVETYPLLLDAGVRISRCHDIALTERILASRSGRFDVPCRAAAVLARAAGAPVPADPRPAEIDPGDDQPDLFGRDSAWEASYPRQVTAAGLAADLLAAYRDQRARVEESAAGERACEAGIAVPAGALRLLLAAESGAALVAAEMTRRGMPWDAAVHQRILTEMLGPRPADGARPARLAQYAEQIAEAFGFPVNPDSPVELREAFRRHGFEIESTRAWVLRGVDHPAVAPVLAYKDLARLFTANGWQWLDHWVTAEGRLRAQFLPGAVVSGRWATRGGGGLQLPAAIRAAAVAKPGYVLVVADAAQLEPRVWAAISGDPALIALTADDDLYTALAADGFGGDRRHAKLAMLGAMYGQTSGEAARLMATMRVRYPAAVAYVEAAARSGETGAVVASVLGRACPPPSPSWRRLVGSGAEAGRRAAGDRGRFTRNFVVQASAADWASAWITSLRLALVREVPDAELVLFLHDEIVIHAPREAAGRVSELAVAAAAQASDLVFPGSVVPTPVRPVTVASYAEAK